MADSLQNRLRLLPAVQQVLAAKEVTKRLDQHGRTTLTEWIRDELDAARGRLLQSVDNGDDRESLLQHIVDCVIRQCDRRESTKLGRVINATGVILHTGLGRAPLSDAAVAAVGELARAGNVEVDLESGQRRYRGHQLQALWQSLTGCDDSLIVNNNAAATLLTLQALCAGQEVVISRGQLIEIGGSFRLPEIFELSGARLREVGTTNRTKLADYERAIGPDTAAIMHVHPSNYKVVGFSETPAIRELAELAHNHNLIAIDDIGSGSLVDVTRFGLPPEPTFPESIQHGADVVLGSGDKLLGGPQAGIILGRTRQVERIRQAPFARTVRVDKLTLAALAATLEIYARDQAEQNVPTVSLLAASIDDLRKRAEQIIAAASTTDELEIAVVESTAPVGGGSLPGAELPTVVVAVRHVEMTTDEFATRLRTGCPRVFPRIHDNRIAIDLRSVLPDDDEYVVAALRAVGDFGTAAVDA